MVLSYRPLASSNVATMSRDTATLEIKPSAFLTSSIARKPSAFLISTIAITLMTSKQVQTTSKMNTSNMTWVSFTQNHSSPTRFSSSHHRVSFSSMRIDNQTSHILQMSSSGKLQHLHISISPHNPAITYSSTVYNTNIHVGNEPSRNTPMKQTMQMNLNNYLQYNFSAVFDMNYTAQLTNKSSKEYANTTKLISHKLSSAMVAFGLKKVVISSLGLAIHFEGSVAANGILYTNLTFRDNLHLLKGNFSREGILNISLTEICSNFTCGDGGYCFQRNASTTLFPGLCRCYLGFKGDRCEQRYPVNGTLQAWTIWTSCSKTCGTGVRRRFRHCYPRPFHNGVCIDNGTKRIETVDCDSGRCPKIYEDKDKLIVGILCGVLFLLVAILLLVFCCCRQRRDECGTDRKKSFSVPKFEALDAYRLPSIAKRPSRTSPSMTSRATDHVIPVQIIKSEAAQSQAGVSNIGFNIQEEEGLDENELVYKKQLKKFFNEAPRIGTNLSGGHKDAGGGSGSALYIHNAKNDLDSIASTLRSPVPQMRKNIKRVKNRVPVNHKIINHGKDDLELVMI